MANNANPMESTEKKIEAEAKSSFLDFEPYCAWQREEESDTLAVHLHGFKKEQIRVQVNNHRIMIIHGQRSIDENDEDNKTWTTRFTKHIKLPENCDEKRISAKFASGVLLITMPKKEQFPNQETSKEVVDNNNNNNQSEKKISNCVVNRGTSCCDEDKESDSVKGLLTMAGKVAAVVLVVAISGAYIHACLYKKPRSTT